MAKCNTCKVTLSTAVEFAICSGGCKKNVCAKCMKLNRSEYKILCDNDSLGWTCSECKNILVSVCSKMDKILNEIENQKRSIEKHEIILQEIRDCLKKSNQNNNNIELAGEIKKILNNGNSVSYADKVKQNDPVVVIIPKNDGQHCDITRKEIKQNLNPINNNVYGMRRAAKGSIVVECKDKEATNKLCVEANAKLGDKYEIKVPTQKNPKLKIINISEEVDDETLIKYIKTQNEFITEESKIKFITLIKNKKKRYPDYSAIIEVDPKTFESMLNAEKISIGWDRCKIFEHIHIIRCYKCLGFNHFSNDCTKNICCGKCAGEHQEKDCNSSVTKCVNCMWAVKNLNMNLDTNHNAFSQECLVLKKKTDQERKKINTSQ